MEEEEYAILLAFVTERAYPENYTKDSKRRLREKASSFVAIASELWHKGHAGSDGVQKLQKVPISHLLYIKSYMFFVKSYFIMEIITKK